MNPLFKKPCLIVNPSSNHGLTEERRKIVEPELLATWPNLQILETTEACRDQNASVILVMGGDGTLNRVVNVLAKDSHIPVGLIPSGSGNDTARSLGWPLDTRAVIRRLLSAQVKMLDLGWVMSRTQKRYFLNVASCGLSAVIARSMREQTSSHYYWETLKAVWKHRPENLRVHLDSATIQHPDCSLLAFASGRFFGGGMQIAPGARMDDGRFDEIAISKINLRLFLRHGLKIYRGKHLELPQVYKMKGRVAFVECLSKEPVYIEADGEDAGELPARFEIFPRSFPVLV